LSALRHDRCDEGIRIVALVGDVELGRLILDQRRRLFDIGNLALPSAAFLAASEASWPRYR
jgi:hypothetical protein